MISLLVADMTVRLCIIACFGLWTEACLQDVLYSGIQKHGKVRACCVLLAQDTVHHSLQA